MTTGYCRICGSIIHDNWKFCRFCGLDLLEDAQFSEVEQGPEAKTPQMDLADKESSQGRPDDQAALEEPITVKRPKGLLVTIISAVSMLAVAAVVFAVATKPTASPEVAAPAQSTTTPSNASSPYPTFESTREPSDESSLQVDNNSDGGASDVTPTESIDWAKAVKPTITNLDLCASDPEAPCQDANHFGPERTSTLGLSAIKQIKKLIASGICVPFRGESSETEANCSSSDGLSGAWIQVITGDSAVFEAVRPGNYSSVAYGLGWAAVLSSGWDDPSTILNSVARTLNGKVRVGN